MWESLPKETFIEVKLRPMLGIFGKIRITNTTCTAVGIRFVMVLGEYG